MLGILSRQHRGHASIPLNPLNHNFDRSIGRVPGHGSGIPKCKIHILAPIQIDNAIAVSFGEVGGERACPFIHPGHGHTAKQIVGLLVGHGGFGVELVVELALLGDEDLELGAIEEGF